MQIKTKEHYDIIAMFERLFPGRFDKEDKALWVKGYVYQDGELNKLFIAFRHGVAFGKALER
jgi:hypothetical protein